MRPEQVAERWTTTFSAALGRDDIPGLVSHFRPDGFWRDLLALTWNIFTAEGPMQISDMLQETLLDTRPSNWVLCPDQVVDEHVEPHARARVISFWSSFLTAHCECVARVVLRDGKCLVLLTASQALRDFPELRGKRRELGKRRGDDPRVENSWGARRNSRHALLGVQHQPFVLIIGGGQAGVMLAARLKRLNVPTIIVEKHHRPGDSWRNRYDTLCLHDAVWYDHFPYLPFPQHWPVFSSKDQMADWIEAYVSIMDLHYWTGSQAIDAKFDEVTKEWCVTIERDGNTLEVHPKHLVIATGLSGMPRDPSLPGRDEFEGKAWHSSQHRDSAQFKGKRAVIVGANNSAHDVATELWAAQASSVTLIQRSATTIIRTETSNFDLLADLYSEQAQKKGITVDKADLLFATTPYALIAGRHRLLYEQIRKQDRELYEGLEQVGFKIDFGEDESGHFLKYLRRGSGYYIDVGACDLVRKGEISVVHGDVVGMSSQDVLLKDGRQIPADVVVFATGYGNMTGWVERLCGKEMAQKIGKCWGLGSGTRDDPGPWQGELRNMWKPLVQEGLWMFGGNLHQCRHYSLVLALQLKARLEGLPVKVYGMPAATPFE